MTSMLKSLLVGSGSADLSKSPSFSDFSMCVGQEGESDPRTSTREGVREIQRTSRGREGFVSKVTCSGFGGCDREEISGWVLERGGLWGRAGIGALQEVA